MSAVGTVRVILVGFGHVGRTLAPLLAGGYGRDAARPGPSFTVTAIITKRHGALVDPGGIDLGQALAKLRQDPAAALGPAAAAVDVIRNTPGDIVVELSSLDIIASGQPAVAHIEAALESGKHVVSANKGPIAFDYHRLRQLAEKRRRLLLFESAVMDGTPVLNMARHCLRGCRVLGFRGILNSTTNFILGEVERGEDAGGALAIAQRRGFAETDPTLDVDGWDAAAKTAILVNVLMGGRITPRAVERRGISDLAPEAVRAAVAGGERVKLVCAAWRDAGGADGAGDAGGISARVAPARVPSSDMLYHADGRTMMVTLRTDLMGEVTVVEHDPDLTQTAYGVLNDLLEVADHLDR